MALLSSNTSSPTNRLSHLQWKRRFFDANNKQDLIEYQYFVENDRWKNGCPFEVEWPHLNVRDMIRDRIVECHLKTLIKSAK